MSIYISTREKDLGGERGKSKKEVGVRNADGVYRQWYLEIGGGRGTGAITLQCTEISVSSSACATLLQASASWRCEEEGRRMGWVKWWVGAVWFLLLAPSCVSQCPC